MVKHNGVLHNNHFRKDWDRRVRTWFDQPGRKQRRRDTRDEKKKAVFPRPASGSLKPLVHCCTKRYSDKQRLGRGFTLEELKAAGLTKRNARGLGVSVDHRRKNQNKETFSLNVERIKAYRSKQVVYPTNTLKRAKKAERKASVVKHKQIRSEIASAVQQAEALPLHRPRRVLEEPRAITEEERKASAFVTLRKAKMAAKKAGDAIKKANAKEKEIAAKKDQQQPADKD